MEEEDEEDAGDSPLPGVEKGRCNLWCVGCCLKEAKAVVLVVLLLLVLGVKGGVEGGVCGRGGMGKEDWAVSFLDLARLR